MVSLSPPNSHPVPTDICFTSGVVTHRGGICGFLGLCNHKTRLVRGQAPVWILVSGWVASQRFGWWHTVGRRPPPSLAYLLGWIKINKYSALSLTKLCFMVVNPTWESSFYNNSCNLIAFFIASLALVSTKFLLGLSWRILQPSTGLLEQHWRRNKLWVGFSQSVPIRGCWSNELIERWLSMGLFIPCWCVCSAWGIIEVAGIEIYLPQKVQVHLLSSVEVDLISLSSPA